MALKSRHFLATMTLASTICLSVPAVYAAETMEDAPRCVLAPTLLEDGSPAARPGKEQLEAAYECFEPRLLEGYAHSKHIIARIFGSWERASDYPFIYDQIGDQYLVVYGNERAVGEQTTVWLDRKLPIGATVVAAGFKVDEQGVLSAAPAMIYEKMLNGYTLARGNWRQTQIAPDGDIIGVTNGPGADNLTVCADCAARSADRLYLAMLNDGVMPADAPEASPPITENELGGGSPTGETLDPGALLDPLTPPSQDNGIPRAETFDPNATLNPSPLAPLDPSTPLDPLAPLDPLSPLDPAPTSSLEPMQDTASLEPLPEQEQEQSMKELSDTEQNADSMGEAPSQDNSDIASNGMATGNQDVLTGLSLELSNANDPLLNIPSIEFADPPPFLEPAGERL
ncbi:MAG: hypothetical protein P1V34_12135 [Alphaproteobacteria bacterium]|nr:hypothetical protein [Alphaproteobacteria bacterium]